ncbi:conserved hypothetical protein [Ricinus communis]|uniref:Uncharacterized protein n=1 Tax=Ricinus communis TaxID=3988 RepID=B9RKH4_RICCO|nr:conserved hypothetical protein [Ricinus communis]
MADSSRDSLTSECYHSSSTSSNGSIIGDAEKLIGNVGFRRADYKEESFIEPSLVMSSSFAVYFAPPILNLTPKKIHLSIAETEEVELPT